MKRITEHGNFCGSPKWTSDSRHVIAYCMAAEQTLANRRPSPEPGSDTTLMTIDIESGAAATVPAGAGVKMNPSPLRASEVGYIRKDAGDSGAGIYYSSGSRGPQGDMRVASWSPDGTRVVFHKRIPAPPFSTMKAFSRNAEYELTLASTILPAFSQTGDRFVTNTRPSQTPIGANLLLTTTGTGRQQIIYHDETRNVLAPQWTPRGDRIIFSVGTFNAFFNGFHGVFLKPEDRAEGGAQVAIVNADGTGFHEVTSGPSNNAFPSLAPDGERFVFRTFGPEGDGLRVMNLDTKTVTTLTRGYDSFHVWS